jgi:hypothetical protein
VCCALDVEWGWVDRIAGSDLDGVGVLVEHDIVGPEVYSDYYLKMLEPKRISFCPSGATL